MNSISTLFFHIYNNKKLILISIFIFSLLVSSFYLIFLKNIGPKEHQIPGTDYLGYYEPVAESISQGKGIPIKEEIAIRYPTGYPLILSGLFSFSRFLGLEKSVTIFVFNVFITAFATCFLFLFVKSIFNKKIALISAILWASYPFNLWLTKNPNTEVPFILLFYIALWQYVLGIQRHSLKFFFISGTLIGFVSLIRPISIFLPFPLAILVFFLIKQSTLKQKLIFSFSLLIAYILVISPWIIYVYLNTGRLIPLSTGGPPSIYGGLTMMISEPKEKGKVILPEDVINLINELKARDMESFKDIFRSLLEKLVNKPIVFLKLIGIKMTRAWYATSETWWEKEILLVQLFYLIPGIIGLLSSFKKFKEEIPYLLLLLIIIIYFWLVTIIGLSILRYMIPVMGILMIFSAITVNTIMNKLIKSSQYES